MIDNNQKIYPYFILATFDDEANTNKESAKYLFNTPKTININYKLGIKQERVKISEALNNFTQLFQNNNWNEIHLEDPFFLIPKQFISTSDNLLNNILKPKFPHSNYIIEFFNERKSLTDSLTQNEIKKINDLIKSKLTINLGEIYDRVGNIIFQFPITILHCEYKPNNDFIGLEIKIDWHHKLKKTPKFLVQVNTKLGLHSNSGFKIIEGTPNQSIYKIQCGDATSTSLIIYNQTKHLLYLYEQDMHFLKSFSLGINLMSGKKRNIIKDGKTTEIELYTPACSATNNKTPNTHLNHIISREKHNDILKLTNNEDFRQFCDGKKEQHQEALDFVKSKFVNNPDIAAVFLWDPYITANDIMDTIYHCHYSEIEFKIIINNNQFNLKDFQNSSDHKGIILEIRTPHEHHGWKFHDRFLILTPKDTNKIPLVWSLGTSLNSLGKKHHIIQKVPNPFAIKTAFNDLWNSLENNCCVIWKHPNPQ